MRAKHLFSALLFVVAAAFSLPRSQSQVAPQAHAQPATPTNKKQPAAAHDAQSQDDGDRIFQQNCSRCHNAPDGFSSRISGTIVRHMRVRAALSQHDEEELLRFLNP